MRKLHKKLISDIVKSLSEANSEIRKLFFNKDMQRLTALLADCFESATQVCEFVNQLEGEGTKTVSYLTEYCAIISRINSTVDDNYTLIKELKNQVLKIEDSIRNYIKPDKFEIVFLPYKAAMFDCMESIWLAAKNDPQCDVCVVPIPFYEKNPDGSLGKMNYEGYQYPDYVEIIDWQQYNIKERCPDAIVTHNIYENSALAASIHPDFDAARLKKYTDLLIYIPYFVNSDDISNDYFVAVKGNISPERIRKSCISTFNKSKEDEDNQGETEYSKHASHGSPRYDKIINAKRRDFPLPQEWERLIGGKKVILYNTANSALINNDINKWLDKLTYVLDTFRKCDDVVLWWRPHLLIEAHLRSTLFDEYKQIVKNYKREDFGIFDNSPDLHRAIVWSDAYYGDGGNLLSLYGVTGKPIMLQNIGVTNFDKHETNVEIRPFEIKTLKETGDLNVPLSENPSPIDAEEFSLRRLAAKIQTGAIDISDFYMYESELFPFTDAIKARLMHESAAELQKKCALDNMENTEAAGSTIYSNIKKGILKS